MPETPETPEPADAADAAGSGAPPRSIRLTDPRALRAYAHPTRMTLVGLLRRSGPFTATRAAELTGESVASCSYHLRILAKYGLVEVAPGGRGREKPWRATARFTDWPGYSEDATVAEASDALSAAVARRYFDRAVGAMEQRHRLPRAWREAEQFTDSLLHLTPEELTEIGERIEALLQPYEDRAADERPGNTRPVSVLRLAFVDREIPGEVPDGADAPDEAAPDGGAANRDAPDGGVADGGGSGNGR
ncbi:transcriptional regulator [Streptomyces longisporoflavus]|uniref:winged helix-turn-helix domain-containing protein n=1 Tax=Streptomyces longisporoflavus TaxID=28044 RepID=UPI00167ED99E|nr:helix-turn-helix domain-containing protein [Streptomyces longisporoflavus]GGV58572.1 transcriptional regulator [Streptomyces longisporoflavus]